VSLWGLAYLVATALLAVYGLNSLVLTWLYLRHRREDAPRPPLAETPAVTVQLPIYNELYVVERLIDAIVRLEYPRDRLQIQVLDDSTDETTAVARARVDFYRAQGIDIELIQRAERTDFKAGALQHGLTMAKGEFIVIFDADFVPGSDFLAKTVPYFLERPRLGVIQTRWGHINADYSPLTRAQAIALDGHFVVEQTARNRSGLFMNFNGTAGIWRRLKIWILAIGLSFRAGGFFFCLTSSLRLKSRPRSMPSSGNSSDGPKGLFSVPLSSGDWFSRPRCLFSSACRQ
jgi:cellulose synthase/poly-beta-1,6-N-acetylglucosamine synthase-like glycosyltransferase